ncbi:MAG: hypothetical protein ACREEM_23065 [Blastocatellia bacterium]
MKSEADAARPLPAETARSLRDYYRVGLTYASNAIEGNSLDLAETKVVIEDGLTIGGKPMRVKKEADSFDSFVAEIVRDAMRDYLRMIRA